MSAIAVSASRSRRGSTVWNTTRTCGTVKAAAGFPQPASLPDQHVLGQQPHRPGVVPPPPPAPLVVVQPTVTRALQDRPFPTPAHPTRRHHRPPGSHGRRVLEGRRHVRVLL